MTKRVAFIGTAIAVLAIGLVGLVLWQTGVIPRQAWTGPGVNLPQIKPYEPEPDNPGGQASLERRQIPVPESGKQVLEPGDPIAPPLVQGGSGPASDLKEQSQVEQGAEKPIPVPQVGKGERRYPGQAMLAQPESDAEKRPGLERGDAETGAKDGRPVSSNRNGVRPVVIRFGFDPVRHREMNVALVHFGDRISVKVRRAGQAGCGLYLVFGFSGTFETDAYREWRAGSRRTPAAPVWDGSRIALTGTDDFGADVPSKLDSKDGAVLKLGGDCADDWRPRVYQENRRLYEIEMKVYPGNRWNIRPKSLL